MFKTKLGEDGFDANISEYRINEGRSDDEIADRASRIETEFLSVLTCQKKDSLKLGKTLLSIDKAFSPAR